jgi:phosphoribosylformylglycinamidine cyclo-ligase
MAPTRIYVKPLLSLMRDTDVKVHALSHITGGGLLENLPRVLPEHLSAHLDAASWQRPEVFNWLQRHGNVDETEMHRVLNCGIGMVLVVSADQAEQARAHLEAQGEQVYRIGRIAARQHAEESVTLDNLAQGDTPA